MFAPKSNTNTTSPKYSLFGANNHSFIQPKLNFGQSGDQYEVEADKVADQIVSRDKQQSSSFIAPAPNIQKKSEQEQTRIQERSVVSNLTPFIQKKCAACEEKEKVQKKEAMPELTPTPIQKQSEEEQTQVQEKPIENGITSVVQKKCTTCDEKESIQKKEVHSEVKPTQKKISKPSAIQKKCGCEDNDSSIQKKEEGEQETMNEALEQIQKEKNFESKLKGRKGKGKKLDKNTQAKMESGFGADFSKVNIHTDGEAAQMSQEIGAQAFTNGNDIFFNKGKYDPNSEEGTHLLAHELTHTVQQGASNSKDIQKIQLPGFVQDGLDAVTGTYNNAVDTVANGMYNLGEALGVNDDVLAAYEAAEDAYDEATEYLVRARDWLVSAAGTATRALVEALGGTIDVTQEGIIVTFPETCPVPAMDMSVPVPSFQQDMMAPVFGIPLVAGIIDGVIVGELGGTLAVEPQLDMQLGPFCLEGARMVINPLTNNYSVEGGVSAMAGVSLGAEIRGGLKAAMSFHGVIIAAGVPVPVSIELIGVEAGLAGLGRGMGVGRYTLSGGLAYSNGSLVMNSVEENEIGLAADAFIGTYGQLSIGGFNFCRLYWEPYSWHGDIGAYFQTTNQVVLGSNPSFTSNSTATIGEFPFNDYEVLLNRGGFEDDCVIEDVICWIMDTFDLYPSNNDGKWEVDGKYGAGGRLDGNVDGLPVFNRTPEGPRGTLGDDSPLCRGACGPNCKTCNSHETYVYTDEETGKTWEYINFEDCSTHEGCQQHDAGFDKALIEHDETGLLDIFIGKHHTLANLECMCTYPLGNCISWVAGGPPSQGRMYFADSVRKITGDSENQADNELEAKIEAINVYFYDKDPEKHRLFIEIKDGEAELMMQSDEVPVEEAIDEKESTSPTEEEQGYLEIAESHRQTIDKLVELHLKKLDPGEEEIEEIVDEIKEELEKLGEYLRNGGVDYFPETPPTLITYGMSGGKPSFVKANPLTFRPGNYVGSSPKEDPAGWDLVRLYKYYEVYLDTDDLDEKDKPTRKRLDGLSDEEAKEKRDKYKTISTTDWVRFHILNDNLHGPGVFWNLLSTFNKDNNPGYLKKIEEKVKTAVDSKKAPAYYFTANVSYLSNAGLDHSKIHPDFTPEEKDTIIEEYAKMPEKVTVNAGALKEENGELVEDPDNSLHKDEDYVMKHKIKLMEKPKTRSVVLLHSTTPFSGKGSLVEFLMRQRGLSFNVDDFVYQLLTEDEVSRGIDTAILYIGLILDELRKSTSQVMITLFDEGVNADEIADLEKKKGLLNEIKTNRPTKEDLINLLAETKRRIGRNISRQLITDEYEPFSGTVGLIDKKAHFRYIELKLGAIKKFFGTSQDPDVQYPQSFYKLKEILEKMKA